MRAPKTAPKSAPRRAPQSRPVAQPAMPTQPVMSAQSVENVPPHVEQPLGANVPPAEPLNPQSTLQAPPQKNKKTLFTVLAVIVVLAVLAVAGFFAYKQFFASSTTDPISPVKTGTQTSAKTTFTVKLDKKWTDKSSPVLLHITGGDPTTDIDMYKAIRPEKTKSKKGSVTIKLPQGDYEVSYISPINSDGSMYETPDDLSLTVEDAQAADATDFEYIPADEVDEDDLAEVISELKKAVKDEESGVTDSDIKIAEDAAAVASPDGDEKLREAEQKVQDSGKTAYTGIVRIVNSQDELVKYIGPARPQAQILSAPYALLLLDKPTGYEHGTNISSTILMNETASYIVLATSSNEPNTGTSVKDWKKYSDKRIVLSGSSTALTYSASPVYYPYNPFATSNFSVEFSQEVDEENIASKNLPSGSYNEIINQDAKYIYSPSSFNIRGNTLELKHGYDGTTDSYSIIEDKNGSTTARRTYTLESSTDDDYHLVYYPDTGDILIGTTRYSVFRKN